MWKGGSDLQLPPPFPRDPLDPVDPLENSGSFILAVKNNDFGNFSGKMMAQDPTWAQGSAWALGPAWAQGLAWVRARLGFKG